MRFGAHLHLAAARLICLHQPFAANQIPPRREVRPLDMPHHSLKRTIGLVDPLDHTVDHLAQVVRRNVGRQSHRNARRPVDQQVGIPRRQHVRLTLRIVEVGPERDCILAKVAQHLQRKRRHPRLGIPHCGSAVAVDRPKVAMPVHQRHPHRKVLRQPHHRLVHAGIAVRVVFTQRFTDNPRRLFIWFVRRDAQFVQRIQYPALHRL